MFHIQSNFVCTQDFKYSINTIFIFTYHYIEIFHSNVAIIVPSNHRRCNSYAPIALEQPQSFDENLRIKFHEIQFYGKYDPTA